ncbi:MAG: GNAT family N-acetyltransferase [Candidatus Latescibacteria bacterium]|nr:GNAT family N-acetyltransferase [Candidatus Latescibacterota bacterium]
MSWHSLPPDQRACLHSLYDGYLYLHGCVAAVLEGGMGTALVDDVQSPTAACLHFDIFCLFAGRPAAVDAVPAIKGSLIGPTPWPALFRRLPGVSARPYPRIALQAGAWDRPHLQRLAARVPEGFEVRLITAAEIDRFAAYDNGGLVSNFPSPAVFLRDALGFGVFHGERLVAGCSTYGMGGGKLEIEIQTHLDFRRRGLATAVAAAFIEHCLDAGLEPCWDAANEESAALAGKLGYVEPTPYDTYWYEP